MNARDMKINTWQEPWERGLAESPIESIQKLHENRRTTKYQRKRGRYIIEIDGIKPTGARIESCEEQ